MERAAIPCSIAAMNRSTGRAEGMTPKSSKRRAAPEQDAMVADALRRAGRALSAYELIDQLRDQAILAPQTVYRSLARLIAKGDAHRLESLNAFIACAHDHHGIAVFAICEACGAVEEFEEPAAVKRLQGWAGQSGFSVDQMTLELRGRCADCRG